MQTEIRVPALVDSDKVVVSQFWLGRNVEYMHNANGSPLSAAEYNSQMTLPTLAELRHAFETNEDYRQSVLSNRCYGEWTSTFVRPRNPKRGEVVPNRYIPIIVIHFNSSTDRIFKNPSTGLWEIEFDSRHAFDDRLAPLDGWVVEYDHVTGFPAKISERRKDAENIFGDDASTFLSTLFLDVDYSLLTVFRGFPRDNDGPFSICAAFAPNSVYPNFGGRTCHRTEPTYR